MDEQTLTAIKDLVPKVLDCLGVKYGASHTELKVDTDGAIRLIECGARMGGDCIGSDLVRLSTGVDFVRAVIEAACGIEPACEKAPETHISAVRFLFGPDDLAALEAIQRENPDCLYRVSEILPFDGREIRDSSTRYGYYIMTAKTQDEMQALLRMSGLADELLE
jgi:biotin carboxylase